MFGVSDKPLQEVDERMSFHRTQIKNEQKSLISNLLKQQNPTNPHLCLALRNIILTEATEDVHEDYLQLPQVISAIRTRVSYRMSPRCRIFRVSRHENDG